MIKHKEGGARRDNETFLNSNKIWKCDFLIHLRPLNTSECRDLACGCRDLACGCWCLESELKMCVLAAVTVDEVYALQELFSDLSNSLHQVGQMSSKWFRFVVINSAYLMCSCIDCVSLAFDLLTEPWWQCNILKILCPWGCLSMRLWNLDRLPPNGVWLCGEMPELDTS